MQGAAGIVVIVFHNGFVKYFDVF